MSERQQLFIDVAKGLADQVDPKLLPQGFLIDALNAVYDKDGRLAKRPGSSPVTVPAGTGAPFRIGSVRGRPCLWPISGGTPVYLDGAPAGAIKSKATYNVRPRAITVTADESDNVLGPDIAVDFDTACIVYTTPEREVITTIIDPNTGVVLHQTANTGHTAKVVKASGYYCVFFLSNTNQLSCEAWTITGLATGAPVKSQTLLLSAGTTTTYGRGNFDVIEDGGFVFIATENTVVNSIRVTRFDPTTSIGTTVSVALSGAPTAMGWVQGATVPTLGVIDSVGGLRALRIDASSLAVTATYTLDVSATSFARHKSLTGFEDAAAITMFYDHYECVAAWATVDFASIAAGTKGQFSFSVTGAVVGDRVELIPPANWPSQLAYEGAVTAPDIVSIFASNSGSTVDPASGLWFVRCSNTEEKDQVRYAHRAAGGTVTTGTAFTGVSLATKAFKRSGKSGAMVGCTHDSDAYARYVFFDGKQPNPEPQVVTTSGSGNGRVKGLSSVVFTATDRAVTALARRTRITVPGSFAQEVQFATALDVLQLGYDDPYLDLRSGPPVEAAGVTWMPGGVLRAADGTSYAPAHAIWAPLAPRLSLVSDLSGVTVGPGTFSYRIVYRWTDEVGRIYRSAVSPASSITVADSTHNVQVNYSYVPQGLPHDTVIEIYRTEANGDIFRKVAEQVAADFLITDNTADADLLLEELLYTSGGVIPNDPPPPFSFVCAHQGRLYGINAERPTEIWVSKPIRDGEGIGWSTALVLSHEEGGGAAALAAQDDRLFILKEKGAIYALFGEAPDELAQNAFQRPQLIGHTGVPEVLSVVVESEGVYFQGAGRYYRISRGLVVEDVGAPVENSKSAAQSAVADSKNQRIIWTSATNTVVYDRRRGLWTRWSLTGYATMSRDLGFYIAKESTGSTVVWRERNDLAIDGSNANVLMTIATSWLQLAGPNGEWRFQELLPLGSFVEAHTFSVSLYYDFDATLSQYLAATATTKWDFSVRPKRQRCSALKIVFSETHTGEATKGFTLSGFRIEFMVRGEKKVRTGRMTTALPPGGGGGG